jgi:nicotinamidase-related amidase
MSEDIHSFYRQRGMSRRVGFGERPSLLIIDFINAFTDLSSPLAADFSKEISATQQLIEAARAKNLLIFFTTTQYEEGFAEAGVFIKKVPALEVLRKGSWMVQVDSRLEPRPGEHLLVKTYASAFFGTPLASTLTANRVDTLIIAGCTTSGCVRASAVDGCQNGFRTIVVDEAVGDRARPPHEANLFDIDAKYGDVVSLEVAVQYLNNFEPAPISTHR